MLIWGIKSCVYIIIFWNTKYPTSTIKQLISLQLLSTLIIQPTAISTEVFQAKNPP